MRHSSVGAYPSRTNPTVLRTITAVSRVRRDRVPVDSTGDGLRSPAAGNTLVDAWVSAALRPGRGIEIASVEAGGRAGFVAGKHAVSERVAAAAAAETQWMQGGGEHRSGRRGTYSHKGRGRLTATRVCSVPATVT